METPCFFRLLAALAGSNWKCTNYMHYMHIKLMILAANCKWTIGILDPGFEQVKKRVVTS